MVYTTIEVLAMQEALGVNGRAPGLKGAMHSIESQPFGRIMLALLAFGLVGYALWKLIQGIMARPIKALTPTISVALATLKAPSSTVPWRSLRRNLLRVRTIALGTS
ncbi:MAG: DUF1206 domain-containing protein [Rubrobacter sp.]|nr:DUF1206 domain-containing protein [Rubrobacter sp.]